MVGALCTAQHRGHRAGKSDLVSVSPGCTAGAGPCAQGGTSGDLDQQVPRGCLLRPGRWVSERGFHRVTRLAVGLVLGLLHAEVRTDVSPAQVIELDGKPCDQARHLHPSGYEVLQVLEAVRLLQKLSERLG